MALFSRPDDKPRKASFFQRIRQAVTGELTPAPEPGTAAAPDAAAPVPYTAATAQEAAPAAPDTDSLVPQNAFELLETEGVGILQEEAAQTSLTDLHAEAARVTS